MRGKLTALSDICSPFSFSRPLFRTLSSLPPSVFQPSCHVFRGSLLVCFLLFGFSSISDSFPSSLSIHLYFHLLHFPLALAGVPSLQGLATHRGSLHCEGCARIRCVRACVRFGVCLIFFRCFVGREKTTNLALFPALFLSPLLEVDAFLKRFDLA